MKLSVPNPLNLFWIRHCLKFKLPTEGVRKRNKKKIKTQGFEPSEKVQVRICKYRYLTTGPLVCDTQ